MILYVVFLRSKTIK